ncbi:pentapeptide repeat-containing protein [Microbacterium sp. HD4P20]|uniref:pentapeptide repeat-containing protein n=1 Tax=Microbacterium sp. HD4P20 TaxID=2864874 RepID=UPI001C641D9D|nr:pentapeptide repeat-containing protein [Microbacterium sp. HD4P20]MCP2635820.1 pentapeptide repeat-containing protein [Microbacterium sp. HD4P20]
MSARGARARGSRGAQAPAFDFDESLLTGLDPGDIAAFEAGRFEAVAYTGLAIDEWQLGTGETVDGCRFTGSTVGSWTLRGARIVESVLDGIDATVVSAARSGLRDVEVRDSRFGSFEAFDSTWRGVRFTRCKLGFVNLRGAELLDVAFVDCTIEELDLLDATARRVAFPGSRIGALNVSGANLTDVDLRGAEVFEVVGLAGLRGATISPEQLHLMAPALAELTGIIVED